MEKSVEPRKLHTTDGNGLFNLPALARSASFSFFVSLYSCRSLLLFLLPRFSSYLNFRIEPPFFLFFTNYQLQERVSPFLFMFYLRARLLKICLWELHPDVSPAWSKSNEHHEGDAWAEQTDPLIRYNPRRAEFMSSTALGDYRWIKDVCRELFFISSD